MIEEVYISGQLGKAIYEDGGSCFVISADESEPVECRPMDFSNFFNFGFSVQTLRPTVKSDLASLREKVLQAQNTHYTCLLVLSGLDVELDHETRTEVVEQAEALLRNHITYRFVMGNLLGRPLPREVDLVGALEIANQVNAGLVWDLYSTMAKAEGYIELVQRVWFEIASKNFASAPDQTDATNELVDLSVFGNVTLELMTGSLESLNSLFVSYSKQVELKGALVTPSLLLNNFRIRLLENVSLPSSKCKNRVDKFESEHYGDPGTASAIDEIFGRFKNRRENPKSRTFKADEAKEKVDHQIRAISNLIAKGNFNLANRYLTDLINFQVEHSEREHLGMSLCSLATIAIDENAFDIALRLVNYALRLGVADAVIPTTQAQLMKFTGDFSKALVVYEETIERFPDDVVARTGYAEVLKSTGDFPKALAVYEETIERFPDDVVPRSGYAEVLKSSGDFPKALAVYEETIERFPDDVVARSGYAEVLKSTGDFPKALAVYEENIERFPNDVFARNGYAEALKSTGEFSKALTVYEETIARFPNSKVARTGYAELLKSTGEFSKALNVYKEAIERFPNDVFARTGYAEVLKSTGEFSKALKVYKETMARFPNSEVASNGYAGVLKAVSKFEEALTLYEKSIQVWPYSRVLRSSYGCLLLQMNKVADARKLLSIQEPRSEADWIDYHVIAMSYLREGDLRQAISRLHYGMNHAIGSQRDYFKTALAVARMRNSDYEKAIKLLATNVSHLDFEERQRRLVLVGHSHAALGKTEEATHVMSQLEKPRNPQVIKLIDWISHRYHLGSHSSETLSEQERYAFDLRIQAEEYSLVLAA
jgi:tetratricopeptide (TPR) repeat protein